MELHVAYAIAFGCFFAIFIIFQTFERLRRRTSRIIESFLRKWLLYAVLIPRRAGSSDCTVLAMVILLSYAAGNAYCAFSGVSSREDLTQRLGKLSLINIIPLYMGGRTSYFVDKWLGVDLSPYHFMHRWIGRVCLIHGLTHAALHSIESIDKVRGVEIAVSKVLASRATDVSKKLAASRHFRRRNSPFTRLRTQKGLRAVSLLALHLDASDTRVAMVPRVIS